MGRLAKVLSLLAVMLLAASLHAQHVGPQNLTAQGTTCGASSTQSIVVSATRPVGGLTFTLSGTWSATVTFYASGDNGSTWQTLNALPSNSATAVSTRTTNGILQANGAGFTNFCALVTAYTSGTVVVSMNLSTASAKSSGGGGGGGGTGCVPGGSSGQVLLDSGSGACTDSNLATDNGSTFAVNGLTATNAVLTTPNLGTPSAVNLTNSTALPCGALPALTGDVTTSAASCTTTVAKIAGVAVGTPTGSTNVVFSNSPTLVTPNLGTPSAVNLTNATALPCGALPALTGNVTTSSGSCNTAIASGAVSTADLAANAVTSAKMAVVNTRRTCDVAVGDTSGSAITNAQLGPQKRVCYVPAASTVVEMDVAADAGTPNVIVAVNHAGTDSNIVSSALATAAAGGIACSNTGGTTGIDGATTCSGTLQNTSAVAGDYLELVSGTAGGTAKLMTIHVIYTVN